MATRRIIVGRRVGATRARRVDDPAVLIALAFVLFGAIWLAWLLAAPNTPADDSIDAGFARDMSRHHEQAVQMAMVVMERTEDETIRTMASDIALTQQAQIGMMTGWLDTWGLPTTRTEPAMAWMGQPTEGPMPGMATAEEIESLSDLPPVEMDIQFLQLMIRHHQGGIMMAEAGEELAKTAPARDLAAGIAAAQQAEITIMQQMLQERGSLPVDLEPMSSQQMDGMAMTHGEDAEREGFTAGATDVLRAALRYVPISVGIFALSWLLIDIVRRRRTFEFDTPDVGWQFVAVGALMLSAMLHAGLTPEHLDERTSYGVFFAISVVVEAVIAAAIINWPLGTVYLAGAAVSLLLIIVWGVFRIVPPPGADAVERVDLIGLVTKAVEVMALGACVRLWVGLTGRMSLKEQRVR